MVVADDVGIRVVLRIEPFLLCSAVQVWLAQNPKIDAVMAKSDADIDRIAALPDDRTVHVVLRERWLQFEVTSANDTTRSYCEGLAALAEHLADFADRSIAPGE